MRKGETYVHGKAPAMARRLLGATERLGLPPFVVRTNDTGFIVPDAVWDEAEAPPEVEEF